MNGVVVAAWWVANLVGLALLANSFRGRPFGMGAAWNVVVPLACMWWLGSLVLPLVVLFGGASPSWAMAAGLWAGLAGVGVVHEPGLSWVLAAFACGLTAVLAIGAVGAWRSRGQPLPADDFFPPTSPPGLVAPPGWLPDPWDWSAWRFWDGTQWTGCSAPRDASAGREP